MRNILIIGIGAGNPDHMTIEAIAALNRADVLFIPDKGAGKGMEFKTRASFQGPIQPWPCRSAHRLVVAALHRLRGDRAPHHPG